MDLSIFFAGTAGSVPTPKRGLPAILLRAGGERILFDCGEGTQHQLLRSIGLPDVDAIFITHLHLDHWLGLPGMIKTFDMRDRDARARALRPARLHRAVRAGRCARSSAAPSYPLDVVELEHHEEVGFDGFVIAGFPVKHRVEAFGYAFIEDDRPGRFDVETATRARRHARARTSAGCSAARPSTASRPSRSWGRTAAAAGSSTPATRCRARPSRSTPTAPTCSSTRPRSARTSGPRARDRPQHGPPGRPARAGRGRQAARADPSLHALLPARDPRGGPRHVREHRRPARLRRRSRSRSRSVGEPELVKTELEPASS